MARGRKKEKEQTMEEKLKQALVPVEEQPYSVPENWCWVYLTSGFAECLDSYRKPINAAERANRSGKIPYYGATGQVGWIDSYLTNEQLVLVGEDGAPFLDLFKDKAYIIEGKAWVNNHAHILRSYYGISGNHYLKNYLNIFGYSGYVNGTTRLKLTQASLGTIPIPLPPLAEQQRIVERIERLFAKLAEAKEKAQAVVDDFETHKAAILHKAFTGELTELWRSENNIDIVTWRKKFLKECSTAIGDGLHGTPMFIENGEYYFVNGNNFSGREIELKQDTKSVDYQEYKKYHIPLYSDSTVLVSINGTLGRTAFYNNEPIILGKSACYVNVTDELDKYFLRYYFESKKFVDYANAMATGSTIKNLGLKAMRNLPLVLPPIKEQKEIVRILDSFMRKEQRVLNIAKVTIAKIEIIKKSILARAFRGELGTNDPAEESAVELLKQVL